MEPSNLTEKSTSPHQLILHQMYFVVRNMYQIRATSYPPPQILQMERQLQPPESSRENKHNNPQNRPYNNLPPRCPSLRRRTRFRGVWFLVWFLFLDKSPTRRAKEKKNRTNMVIGTWPMPNHIILRREILCVWGKLLRAVPGRDQTICTTLEALGA